VNWSSAELAEVPPDVVTVTTTVSVPGGEVAVSDVELKTFTAVAATVPKSTVASLAKPVPVTVTTVPPVTAPLSGLMPVTVGSAKAYVNWSPAELVELPAPVVTVTFTVPVPAGEVAVSDVELVTSTSVAATVPKSTVAPLAKPVPVTLTDVPPVGGPVDGLTWTTVGAASAPV
jgi:hypothetical protein